MATLGLLLFIALLVVVAAYSGYQTGLIQQIGALAGIIIALVVCNVFGTTIVVFFTPADATPDDVSSITAFTYIAVFLVVYMVVYMASGFLKGIAGKLMLRTADKVCGSLFRVAEWFIFLCILLYTLSTFLTSMPLGGNPLMQKLIALGETVMGVDIHTIMAKAL